MGSTTDNQASLAGLPIEIHLRIAHFLDGVDIAQLQLVNRKFLQRLRDQQFWRVQSFEESGQADDRRKTSQLWARSLANWDPYYPRETPDWYNEYIQRNAPITINWFQQAYRADTKPTYHLDVRGVSLYQPGNDPGSCSAFTPMADGSLYLWDVRGTGGKRGAVLGKSAIGAMFHHGKGRGKNGELTNAGVIERVAVDSHRDIGFVAADTHLVHVDLHTLQAVSSIPFPWVISCLSEAHPGVPLTVGTNLGVHLYDYRSPTTIHHDRSERVDLQYAPLAQPGPLSILHLERPGQLSSVSDDIYIAGRFSNILHYDRRYFSQMQGSIYSGSRLCALASLPFGSTISSQDQRRRNLLSLSQVHQTKSQTGMRTIIAGGEYNTKGSLEVYPLLPSPNQPTTSHTPGDLQQGAFKNRQTASSSKILSLITHGSRVVFSDASGLIKWFERDGVTEVRRCKIGHSFQNVPNSLFASMPGSDDVARKMLAIGSSSGDGQRVNEDDILFWTGEKLGLLTFSTRPGSVPSDFETEEVKTKEEMEAEEKEAMHSQMMKEALEWHTTEMRFVQGLGCS